MKRSKRWPHFGIVLSHGRVVYGPHSFWWWLPRPIERWVATSWNIEACDRWGHRWLCREMPGAFPICADCCRFVRDFDESQVINEYSK